MAEVDVVDKLDMSLDQISDQRKQSNQSKMGRGGKAPNTKRAERRAKSSPYSNSPRGKQYLKSNANNDIGKRVYVGNLSWGVDWRALKDHMSQAGIVEHADVLSHQGRSKGCGLVTYASAADAKNAIETLNDTELDGRQIFVREDREEESSGSNKRSINENCRVYVGNLSWNIKWQDLKDHMRQAGTVVHADVLEEAGGRSKGCGLVEYSSAEEAREAIETLNDTELDGRQIFVREDREPGGGSISSMARRGGSGAQRNTYNSNRNTRTSTGASDRQVYVGNLSWDCSWQDLKDLFREVGEVEFAEIPENRGRSRGYGLVRFVSAEDAAAAIEQLNDTEFKGRTIEVRYERS